MNTQTAIITRQHWHAEQTKRPTRLWTFSSTRYGSFYDHCHLLNLRLWHVLPVMLVSRLQTARSVTVT